MAPLFQQPFMMDYSSINRTAASVYDYLDTFDTDQWTKNDTQPVVSGGVATFTIKNDSSNDAAIWDPKGSAFSDTLWTLDWDWKPTTNASSKTIMFALSDSVETVDSATAQEFIEVRIDHEVNDAFVTYDGEGVAPFGSGSYTQPTWTTNTQYYNRLIRKTATTYDAFVYTDSDRTTTHTSITAEPVASTVQSLRYIKYMNRITSAVTDDVDDIDNVGIVDGVDLNA